MNTQINLGKKKKKEQRWRPHLLDCKTYIKVIVIKMSSKQPMRAEGSFPWFISVCFKSTQYLADVLQLCFQKIQWSNILNWLWLDHENAPAAQMRPGGVQMLLWLFSHLVVSYFLQPHGLQHTRPPCPSPSPKVCPSWYPLVIPSNHLILWCPLLFLPSIFPSTRDFSN